MQGLCALGGKGGFFVKGFKHSFFDPDLLWVVVVGAYSLVLDIR